MLFLGGLMRRIKMFFNKHKVTIMVIPNAEKSIKQWKFNLAIAFTILITLIIINLSLLVNTVSSNIKSANLKNENVGLSSDIIQQKDRIQSLENINQSKNEEISQLKTTMEDSINYLDTRLKELNQLDGQISSLLTLFNENTQSALSIPTSRSYDRNKLSAINQSPLNDNALLSEMEYLVSSEEISSIIESKGKSYTELIDHLSDQLEYLSCRPDFVPTDGVYTSPFGFREDPVYGNQAKHNGIDLANAVGTPIHAAGAGIVTYANYNKSFGYLIIIDHGYGYKSVYGHNSELLVKEGDTVQKGQLISKMGSTGKSTGSHLHFEIRYHDTPINPLTIINLDDK